MRKKETAASGATEIRRIETSKLLNALVAAFRRMRKEWAFRAHSSLS